MIAAMETPLIRRMVPLVLALVVVVVIVELIRRRKLLEEYAIFWFCSSIALLIVAIFPNLLINLQGVLQTNYLTLVVLICVGLAVMIMLHFSVAVSRQTRKIRQLAQQYAILESKLKQYESGPSEEEVEEKQSTQSSTQDSQ